MTSAPQPFRIASELVLFGYSFLNNIIYCRVCVEICCLLVNTKRDKSFSDQRYQSIRNSPNSSSSVVLCENEILLIYR